MAKRLGRHGHRDATMIQLAYRHGLRVAELIALRWDQVDLDQAFVVRALAQRDQRDLCTIKCDSLWEQFARKV